MNLNTERAAFDCLNGWPDGTVGWEQEQGLLDALYTLCEAHGYGRVPQLTQQMEDIWRNPEKRDEYVQRRKERVALLLRDRMRQ